jgi:hypothetical protein
MPVALHPGGGVAVFIRVGVGAPGVMLIGFPSSIAGRFLSEVSRLFRSLTLRQPFRHPACTRARAANSGQSAMVFFSHAGSLY